MRILITNDDGITAPGIQSLWRELSEIGEVTVVAPDVERSATSQSITVHHPIRVDRFPVDNPAIQAWRVGGTPTDCVKLALETLMEKKPDIVVSGINNGPNLGTDVLYSGTVSAAIEGALHGFPAVAFSLNAWKNLDFRPAARYARKLLLSLEGKPFPGNTLLNVNVPHLPEAQIAGVEITKLGAVQYTNIFDRRQDPRGRVYYWMGGSIVDTENDDGTDVAALKKNKISITPVHFDLTNYAIMHLLEEWNLST